jgi:hypothetical protein
MRRWTITFFFTVIFLLIGLDSQAQTDTVGEGGYYKINFQILSLNKKILAHDTVSVNGQTYVTDSLGYISANIKWENKCYGLFRKYKRQCLDLSNQKYIIIQRKSDYIFVKNRYRHFGIKGKRQKKPIKVYAGVVVLRVKY